MANIVRWDRINFQGGRFLDVPVFNNGNIAAQEAVELLGRCCIIGWKMGYDSRYSSRNFTECVGLPLGSSNALIDMDGGRWYYTLSNSGNDYIFSITFANNTVQLRNWTVGSSTQIKCGCSIIARNGENGSFVILSFNDSGFYLYENEWIGGSLNRFVNYDNASRAQAPDINYVNDRILANCYSIFSDNFGYALMCKPNGNTNNLFSANYINRINISANNFSASLEVNVEPDEFDSDTNSQGGNSTVYTGGHGNFDRTSDNIAVPVLPTLNATNAGFVTLFTPSLSNLLELAEYLWSTNLLNILISYFSNPMDIIIGLGIVPVTPPSSSSKYPTAGAITVPISMPVCDSQYYELDCGSLTVNEFWGSALDYSPFTQIQIYLPYIGVRELNVDEIMGKSIGVKYHIDLFGGACVAFVTVDGSVKYQYSGNCIQQIPINAANYDQLVQNLVSVACVVGTGIAAAGAGAAAAIGEEASMMGPLSTNPVTTASQLAEVRGAETVGSLAKEGATNGLRDWASGNSRQLAQCAVDSVMASKPRVERTGSLSATAGQLCVQKPYLIITRPEQSLPKNYRKYEGYPSNITAKLSSLEGFTKVNSIRLNNIPATQPEIMEIYSLLHSGVII